LEFFEFDLFIELLKADIQSRDEYIDKDYVYLPRETYVESIMKVFYKIFYPS